MRVIDDSLFAALAPVTLRGSRCSSCSAHVFPAMSSCPVCTGVDVEDVPLPTRGTVWSWTTQRFAPKPPYRRDDAEEFAPFSIGYVDLGPVIVEGWLVGKTAWVIGEPVDLVLARAWTEGDDEVRTFAFVATGDAAAGEAGR